MPIPILTLPQPLGSRPGWLPSIWARRGLHKWLRHSQDTAGPQLIEPCLYKLIKFNGNRYAVKSRLEILSILQQALSDLFHNERQFIRTAIHATTTEPPELRQLDKLFEEFANGYKLVIHQLAHRRTLNEAESVLMQEAIYYALKFLAHRLLLAYAQYATPAKTIWREINQIYRYAELNQLQYHIVDDPVSDCALPVFHSGEFVYKRITLVALAEPFRLMKGECLDLYHICCHWAGACSLLPLDKLATQGEHVVDVADDLPPRYVTLDLDWKMLDGRLIDISEVIGRLEEDLQKFQKNQTDNPRKVELADLEERQQRNMLLRVLESYRGKPVRKGRRFNLSDDIRFTMGINNCHAYLANRGQFTPYIDELKHITQKQQDDKQAGQFAGLYKQALEQDRNFTWREQPLEQATQKNINPLGLALSYRMAHHGNKHAFNVGELIAYRPAGKSDRRWVIGIARWIRRKETNSDDTHFDVGIKNIARNGIPVAVRDGDDVSTDNPYYRALLIPRHVSHQQLRSLLVPAHSFETDNTLLLNTRRGILHIRLTRMLAASNAYAQFEFERL